MSQLSGAFTIEVPTDRLAERIARRVVELLTAGTVPDISALGPAGPVAGRASVAPYSASIEASTGYDREPDLGEGGADPAAHGRHAPDDIGLDDGLPGAGS